MLAAVLSDDIIDGVRAIPTMSNETIRTSMGLNYNLTEFKFFNVAQSLLYNNKQLRVDDTNEVMKIVDLGNRNNADHMVGHRVSGLYMSDYQKRLGIQKKEEVNVLSEELVNNLISVNVDEFVQLMKDGINRGTAIAKIYSPASIGFTSLRDKLLDLNAEVKGRLNKLTVILLGRDQNNEKVWNNGNVLFNSLEPYEKLFNDMNQEERWTQIKAAHRSRRRHVYRDKENRHGHSNDLPSFWALGFRTVEDMVRVITKEEWEDYKSKHVGCCGL